MIISKTPMRISFVGGGSDFKDYYKLGHGEVVSTAIDRYVYLAINRSFGKQYRICYSKTEYVNDLNKIKHNIIREALKITKIDDFLDITYLGDIPIGITGTGLGASSSLAVGLLNALYAYKGESASAEKLAEEACRIEIDILNHPIGKQDQYITAFGGFNHIRFNADESVFVTPIPFVKNRMKQLKKKMMLFYTGLTSDSKTVLTEQKKKIDLNIDSLNGMVELCGEFHNCLQVNKFSKLGFLLHQNWLSKKTLASKVSNPTIDVWYSKALKAGAKGGKILGSGGGGFLLFYCDEKFQDNVRHALWDLQETSFNFEPQGSTIIHISN